MTTYIHKFKCLGCGLHFAVFSWYEDKHNTENTFCPECGVKGKSVHWVEKSDMEIYVHIPGNATIVSFPKFLMRKNKIKVKAETET